jgi:hypothetical protein
MTFISFADAERIAAQFATLPEFPAPDLAQWPQELWGERKSNVPVWTGAVDIDGQPWRIGWMKTVDNDAENIGGEWVGGETANMVRVVDVSALGTIPPWERYGGDAPDLSKIARELLEYAGTEQPATLSGGRVWKTWR